MFKKVRNIIIYTYLFMTNIKKVYGIKVEKYDYWAEKIMILGALTKLPDSVLNRLKKANVRIWYQRKIVYPKAKKKFAGFCEPSTQLIGIQMDTLDNDKDIKNQLKNFMRSRLHFTFLGKI